MYVCMYVCIYNYMCVCTSVLHTENEAGGGRGWGGGQYETFESVGGGGERCYHVP